MTRCWRCGDPVSPRHECARPEGIPLFTYGMLLDPEGALSRWTVRPPEPVRLLDHRLVFRGVADVEERRNFTVPGALWYVSDHALEACDAMEGVSPDDPFSEWGLYRRKWAQVETARGERLHAIVYQMNVHARGLVVAAPHLNYLGLVVQGYRALDLPLEELQLAVRESARVE